MAKQSINPKLQILNKKDCVGFLLKFNSLVHIGVYCYLLKENIKLIIPFEARVHAAMPTSSHNISYIGCRIKLYIISFLTVWRPAGDLFLSFFLLLFCFVLFCFVLFVFFGEIAMKSMMS